MYAIYAYIGVVLGVNVGIYGSPTECLGFEETSKDMHRLRVVFPVCARLMVDPSGFGGHRSRDGAESSLQAESL